jgi:hypothetical protein
MAFANDPDVPELRLLYDNLHGKLSHGQVEINVPREYFTNILIGGVFGLS